MSLNLSIANALSGVRVAQRNLDAVAQNIGNAQTPGYTRKTLAQENAIIGGTGAGVRAGELRREVDTQLQADLRRSQGRLAGQEVTEGYLQRIEEMQGRPEDQASLSSSFTKLQTAFEKLSATPEDRNAQIAVVSQADSFAKQLNGISAQVLDLRNQTQSDIKTAVDDMNGRLTRIDELNKKIVLGTQEGRSTADMEDLRDQELSGLSKLVDITTVRSADNRMIVLSTSGQTLVDRSAEQFDFRPTPLDDTSFYRASPPGTIPGITVRGSGRDVTGQLTGGKLGALVELRDATLPKLQGQMDEFAQKLAQRFQQQGMTLFTDRDGSLPPDAQGAYAGFAGRIQVNSAAEVDPGFVRYGDDGPPTVPADQAVANARIMKVLNHTFGNQADAAGAPHAPFRTAVGPDIYARIGSGLPAQASLGDYLKGLVVSQGQMRADVTASKKQTEDLTTALDTKASNLSGVNLDTEIANLTMLQRSYAASAQVLKISQQLMDELFAIAR